jgi:hypothetical protein
MPSLEELKKLDDKKPICSFVISGQPATKKNSSRIIWANKRLRVIPSKQYMTYEKNCQSACEGVWKLKGNDPINFGVSIRIKAWISRWQVPDHVGILQSLGDILQHWKVISDDKYIHWTDLNYDTNEAEHWLQGKDAENPRVEIFIYRFKHPVEEYDLNKKTASKSKKAAVSKSKKAIALKPKKTTVKKPLKYNKSTRSI